jgi:glyoxylate reductase
VERLRQRFEVRAWEGELPPDRATVLEEAARCEGLLTLLTERIDEELLARAGKLKIVSNMAVGFDNIDVAACTRRGIAVGNTPGVLTETTADFAFALLLSLARRTVEADAFVRRGAWKTWDPNLFLGRDVFGATLGIVGFGLIGQAMARRARGFGMRILFADPKPWDEVARELGATRVELEALLAESDFVSLHVPLNERTRHLIGERALAQMKPTAMLVNTARGPVVDPRALERALREGRLLAAALDVTEPEPIPPDDPLLTLPNLVIAPHIASASVATRSRMASMAADNVIAALEGRRPPNCVNPAVFDAAR